MKKSKIVLAITLILAFIMNMCIVYADADISYTLDKDNITAKLGDTIQVVLGVADIDTTESEHGINSVKGQISYDKTFIESVQLVSAGDNWSIYQNEEESEQEGTFVAMKLGDVIEAQPVVKFIITLKTDATAKTGTLKIQNLVSSYGRTETTPQTKTVNINIEDSVIPDIDPDEPTPDPTPDPTPAPAKKSDTQTQDTTTKTTTTTKTSTLPKAGIVASGIGIAVLAAIIVAVIEYVKYRRTDK